jgi:hypothetical protein
MRNVDDIVFSNIRRSHLHTIVARTPVMPCSKDIEWIIKHTNTDSRIVLNDEKRCIASYQPSKLEQYYKIHHLEKYTITSFVESLIRVMTLKIFWLDNGWKIKVFL